MTVRVRLFADIRETAGAGELTAEGATVGEVLEDVVARHPELEERLYGDDGLRSHVNVTVDGEPADTDTSTEGVEEVAVYPPVSGGAASV